jgi:SAM-dependent methyltransferase
MENLNEHIKILNNDYKEAFSLMKIIKISLKLSYYRFSRTAANFFIKKSLKEYLANDLVFNKIDRFLLNEGGMFKKYAYGLCNQLVKMEDAKILVPGVGYGRNIFQLAAFKPKFILAFDLYEYKEEWKYLSEKLNKMGIEIIFIKGDFDNLPTKYQNSFDLIISDAVLEHVKNLPEFLKKSKSFLKKDGLFYASFGPIWYGPGGDHIDWGKGRKYDHLLLSEAEYQKQFQERFENKQFCEIDSCEGKWMVEKKLFSYLKAEDYLKIFKAVGFRKNLLFAKISTEAFSLLKSDKNLWRKLNQINAPFFDRFCSGFYLWMKK